MAVFVLELCSITKIYAITKFFLASGCKIVNLPNQDLPPELEEEEVFENTQVTKSKYILCCFFCVLFAICQSDL